jgi:hypothetical protein
VFAGGATSSVTPSASGKPVDPGRLAPCGAPGLGRPSNDLSLTTTEAQRTQDNAEACRTTPLTTFSTSSRPARTGPERARRHRTPPRPPLRSGDAAHRNSPGVLIESPHLVAVSG